MRTTDRSMSRGAEGYATIPDLAYLRGDEPTATNTETATLTRAEPLSVTRTDIDVVAPPPRPRVRARGSQPPPPGRLGRGSSSILPIAVAAAEPAEHADELRSSLEELVSSLESAVDAAAPAFDEPAARLSASAFALEDRARTWPPESLPPGPPMPLLGPPARRELALPRSSTAAPYPLVAMLPPPLVAPAPRPSRLFRRAAAPISIEREPAAADRPIAWGRVIAAIALMSALMGGAIARLTYRGPSRSSGGAAAAPASVAVLLFENRASDPALRDAPPALARALSDELAAQTMLELAADPAPGAAVVVRGALEDRAGGGAQLRVEVVRRSGKPVTVLEHAVAPGADAAAELAAALRAGVPAFAGLLVDPRELPRHLALGRRALLEDRALDAARHLRTVLLHDPNHRDAIFERALAVRWSDEAAGAAALREALAAPLAPPQRDLLAAHLLLAEGELPAALAAFTELAAAHPRDVHALLGLFDAQRRAGRTTDATVTYLRAREVEPRLALGARLLPSG